MNAAERFVRFLEPASDGCVIFTGCKSGKGYGRFSVDGVLLFAHRYAWTSVNGPIPDGMHVMHSCDNPPCCNPEHLSIGTNAENVADKMAKGRYRGNGFKDNTHCKHGHEYTPENTYIRPSTGWRECRICIATREPQRRSAA